jgi:CRP/FNR family cyclic AMP-dependent transcriptional regulator
MQRPWASQFHRGSRTEPTIPGSVDELLALLRQHPVFTDCHPTVLQQLARASIPVFRPPAGYVFRQGEPAAHAFVVGSGEVLLSSMDRHGSEQIQRIVRPGELFGELELLTDGWRTTAARTASPTSAWAIAGDAFLGLLTTSPRASVALLRQVAELSVTREAELSSLLSLDIKGRLASILLTLAERHGQAEPGGCIRISTRLTHKDLGSIIGASGENVSRALARLRTMRLIDYSTQAVLVLDPDQLRRLT